MGIYKGESHMTKKELSEIGERLRSKRIALNLTREQFAELADISPSFYGQLEVGGSQMSLDTLLKISKALHVDMEYILLGTVSTDNSKALEPVLELLHNCSARELKLAYEVLKLFLMKN